MPTESNKKIDVRGDGRVILYRREHLKKPRWQARISVPDAKGYKVLSTGLTDLDEAKRFALNKYEELYMQVKAGGQLNTKTFKQIYEEWKAHAATHGRTRRDGSWDTTIDRIDSYALEFFGMMRIDAIKEADFTKYWEWRRQNYSKKAPANSTLKRERTSIMPVFKYALSKGYIAAIPPTNTPRAKGNRRPTFAKHEWEKIQEASVDWVKKADELATYRDRYYAQVCFILLVNSGLRIGELREMRWKDISIEEGQDDKGNEGEYTFGFVPKGKTGAREISFQPGVEVFIRKLKLFRTAERTGLFLELTDPSPDENELLLCHPDGRSIHSFKHSFKSLLSFAGVPVESDGKPRTLYSFRHYYATQGIRENLNPVSLAKQMGTSVDMIERHYAQVMPRESAPLVTRRKPSKIAFRKDIVLKF
jgi:integrase